MKVSTKLEITTDIIKGGCVGIAASAPLNIMGTILENSYLITISKRYFIVFTIITLGTLALEDKIVN